MVNNNSYADQNFSLVFDNGQSVGIGYHNNSYDKKHGIYIYTEGQQWCVHPKIVNEWVEEKIIVNYNGKIQYYSNGELLVERGLSSLNFKDYSSVHISASPGGWYTGHFHFMDDYSLSVPGKSIRDDFNDGVIDMSIWELPVNPDGVNEADGYMQLHQLRTNQDFSLKSKPVSIPY